MTVMERWYEEVWNKGNAAAIDELLSPDVKIHGLPGIATHGPEGIAAFKELFKTFRSALTELHVKLEQVVSEGDFCAVRCVVTATHTGEGLGIAPKGKSVCFTGMNFARIEDGRIAEGWNNFDFPTMYQQME